MLYYILYEALRGLSELTSTIFNTGLTHFDLEASIYNHIALMIINISCTLMNVRYQRYVDNIDMLIMS